MSEDVTTADEAWQLVGADGTPLHGRVVRAPQQRAAMLLAHGFAEHRGRYEELTGALTGAGITVLSYDHRGHGRSPGRRSAVDLEVLVRDHLAVRRQVQSLLGPSVAVFLHGHSLGGAVVAASVLRRPRDVPGVLLSSPALSVAVPVSGVTRAAGKVLSKIAPGAGTVRLDSGAISRIPAVVADYEADPLVFRGRTPAITAISLLEMGEQVLARCPGWAVPALVVHGTADALTDIDGSRRFAQEAGAARDPRPPVRLVEIEGGYHELYHDTVATPLLGITLAWLQARLT